ncbi:MAG: winged helix-turn-helix transcriptional regulator [Saccharospirillaceae bacterium]|nr:MarR family winged helix-turn-helix transcriptional regulator [Pseudomonadales bacterium]NRB80510.1 winged helix-turn-helix transcriptional regulator [Saccharospirillaceae bacterium]
MTSTIKNNVLKIQSLYPKIYFACHQDHIKARSSTHKVSNRDNIILAHLFEGNLSYNKELAQHLNVSTATMSQALNNLVVLEFVQYVVDDNDERRSKYSLTTKGQLALQDSSVLNTEKLTNQLNKLTEQEQLKVIEGLRLLALI